MRALCSGVEDSQKNEKYEFALNVRGTLNAKLTSVPSTLNQIVHVACSVRSFIMLANTIMCPAMMQTSTRVCMISPS